MDMVRHNTIFIHRNSRIMFRDLQNRRFYNCADFRQVRAAGCRPYIPENRFSVIYADRNEICSGGGIIVILNADRFAFWQFVHRKSFQIKYKGNIRRIFQIGNECIPYLLWKYQNISGCQDLEYNYKYHRQSRKFAHQF